MSEEEKPTFITATPDETIDVTNIDPRQADDDDDLEIDEKSSADSADTPIGINEIEEILNKDSVPDNKSSLNTNQPADLLADKMSHDDPSPSAVGEQLQAVIPRAVYEYAAVVQEIREDPRQAKLKDDVQAVLGSSDPPAGFGFLHPRYYYLEQKRPIPMEPLRVWRGYNGHVYFSPIQVQPLESERVISPTKPRRSNSTRPKAANKSLIQRSHTVIIETDKNRSPLGHTTTTNKSSSNEIALIPQRADTQTSTQENELKNNTLATFAELEERRLQQKEEANKKMWSSIVTCVPVQVQPMSKRRQHTIDDLKALQQSQNSNYSKANQRPVLPNIRPIPKTKYLYRGLAFKEGRRISAIGSPTPQKPIQQTEEKPLVDYNLSQAYVRYDDHVTKTVTKSRTSKSAKNIASMKMDSPIQRLPTSVDIREIRKRIVKGSTLSYHPPASQTNGWTQSRNENKAHTSSEVFLPRSLSTALIQRPSTSKSSIPTKQNSSIDMPILTKYLHRSRNDLRQTPTTDTSL